MGQLGGRLMGRVGGGDKENAIQFQQTSHVAREAQVSSMNGIEGAPKNGNPQLNLLPTDRNRYGSAPQKVQSVAEWVAWI
jgi:hypothetical protein